MTHSLPPGQRERTDLPRFGLPKFAAYRPSAGVWTLTVGGAVEQALSLGIGEINALSRVDQVSDFHCVTTWSCRQLRWSGFRFREFYQAFAQGRANVSEEVSLVVFDCQDGFRTCLPLVDLLADDVLLADRLNEQALSFDHGAPLRLVAPAHYGYKNAKHIRAVSFWSVDTLLKIPSPGPRFMDHPRARVAYEERGRGLPGWVYRFLYRPLVRPTQGLFAFGRR